MYTIIPMTTHQAEEISRFTYTGEYSVYSFTPHKDTTEELMNGEYFACVKDCKLIGYFCYGKSAQIPTAEENSYSGDFLDIGLGIKPELCGMGLGAEFLQAGIKFAHEKFNTKELRLTVACFNKRATRLYESVGFYKAAEVKHKKTEIPFYIMKGEEK